MLARGERQLSPCDDFNSIGDREEYCGKCMLNEIFIDRWVFNRGISCVSNFLNYVFTSHIPEDSAQTSIPETLTPLVRLRLPTRSSAERS